jgi:biopolymer transport protein ExbD
MTFKPKRTLEPIGFNLTPMIDVTFQLLIFFVCANTWGHVEMAEKLDLPAPIRSARDPAQVERPRLTVNLRPNGELLIMGRVEPRERLAELARAETRRHGERLEVILRAHRDVPYARTQEVFKVLAEAGVRKVRFAVLRDKG